MQPIFLAFENETNRRRLRQLLEGGGLEVRGLFRGGAETVRAVRRMGGGVVICGYKLPDMTADDLSDNLEGLARVAVVAHADRLDLCQNPRLVRICSPFSRDDLLLCISALCREETDRLAEKKREAADVTAQAKAWLMEHAHMDEAAAHRYLQRKSMALGKPIRAVSALILAENAPHFPSE